MGGRAPARPGAVRLVSAGVAMVGVSFGLARYGYGLLLPELRAEFDLTSAALGLIGAGSYAAYLIATALVGALAARTSPRPPVVAGGVLATIGMLLVAAAPSAGWLAVGVLVAGASAGLTFPPFSDAVRTSVSAVRRGRALATISAGTGTGVLVAAPTAALLGGTWRAAWIVFAALAAAATVWAAVVLRGVVGVPAPAERLRLAWFVCPRSGPLLAGALLVGLGSSVWWTFAVDFMASDGGLSTGAAQLMLGLTGLASVLGAAAGDLLERVGGRGALALAGCTTAAALALLTLATPAAAVLAAVLFGAGYNLVVGLQGIWSTRVFAERPAVGLAAVMFVLSVGLLVGPVVAGVAADAAGMPAVLLTAAAVIACAGLLGPRQELRTVSPAAS